MMDINNAIQIHIITKFHSNLVVRLGKKQLGLLTILRYQFQTNFSFYRAPELKGLINDVINCNVL